MKDNAAYHNSYNDDQAAGIQDGYEILHGPDGFECILTEPEDRRWCRDLDDVVDRLNEQHAEIARLRAIAELLVAEHADGVHGDSLAVELAAAATSPQ